MTRPVRVLVVGSPRSGTTLVQRILSEESGLTGGPESHFFTHLLGLRSFTASAVRAALEEYPSISQLQGTEVRLSPDASVGRQAPRLYDVFQEVVQQLNGADDWLSEKTPGHLWFWRALASRDADLKFVIVVRDPRAVVSSVQRAGISALSPELLAETWNIEQAMAHEAVETLGPDRCLVVRYEDVVSEEVAVRRALSSFVGLREDDPATGADAGAASPLMLDWEDWKSGYDRPVDASRGDAWRHELAPEQAATVAWICRRQMGRLGYSSGRPGRPRGTRRVRRLRLRVAVTLRVARARRLPL